MMQDDEWVAEGDLDAAREIVSSTKDAELLLYEGDRHLFVDETLADHDEGAAAQVVERMLAFLDRL
jgi:dienelactone hydrolase